MLGFPATPATGYALGVERILMVARALGTVPALPPAVDVLVCSVEPGQARRLPRPWRALLRDARARTVLDVAERRLDRKLRAAGRIGARVAVIIGENEVAATARWFVTSMPAVSRPYPSASSPARHPHSRRKANEH